MFVVWFLNEFVLGLNEFVFGALYCGYSRAWPIVDVLDGGFADRRFHLRWLLIWPVWELVECLHFL